MALSGSLVSKNKIVKVMRTFRTMRLLRILMRFKFVKIVGNVMNRIINSFFYTGILLLLFNVIYGMLGKSLYGLKFTEEVDYSTFISSFLLEF